MNIMTQWGTLLIYFRMPDWVKDLDESIVEKTEDPDDIKAFKVRTLYRIIGMNGESILYPQIHALCI